MLSEKNREAEEQSNIFDSAEKTNKENSSLVNIMPLAGTPFSIVGNEEKGYWIAMGDYKITEAMKRPDEAALWIEQHKWETILNLMSIVVDINERAKRGELKEIIKKLN